MYGVSDERGMTDSTAFILGIVIIALGVISNFIGTLYVKCPSCTGRPLWKNMKEMGIAKFPFKGRNFQQCPLCNFTGREEIFRSEKDRELPKQ